MMPRTSEALTVSDPAYSEASVAGSLALPTVQHHDGILDRAKRFSRRFDRFFGQSANPFNVVIEDMTSAVEAMVNGRPTLLFGTNSYLGLNFHPACRAAASQASERFGTGSTASRVAGGTSRLHLELEREIAAFYGARHCVVFSSGFMANQGVISSLVREGDAIFFDAHCHASMIDAAKLSGAEVRFFRHNDPASLEQLFRVSAVPPSQTLVAMEGLYSVTGDTANLRPLLTTARERGAVTLVDEAHALGIYGANGRGVLEESGTEDLADVIVGTFSKSVGVVGGFSVTKREELHDLCLRARSYLYTAALPPAVIASAREAVRLIASEPAMRERLWRNADYFRAGLARSGLTMSGEGPIGRISPPSIENSVTCWSNLLRRGVYVNFLIPPSTPDGTVALRLSVSAAHEKAHLDRAIEALSEVLTVDRSA